MGTLFTPHLVVEDDFLKQHSDEEVPRFIIIDAPNIMFCANPSLKENENLEGSRRANVTGLLTVLRYFLKNDFDVIAISQHKYTFDGQVTHTFAMKRLMDLGLVVVPDNHCYDDVLALEAAHATDGVIISNDQFKDHVFKSEKFRILVSSRTIPIKFMPVSPMNRHVFSLNGHYIADHIISFPLNNDMNKMELHKTFFSTPYSICHEISCEHRNRWSAELRDDYIMEIDCMLENIRASEGSLESIRL